MTARLTIGEVARRTDVPIRTIRFYEAAGVIPRPPRTEGGYRLYSATDVRLLRFARRARLLGLPLAEVKALIGQASRSGCVDFGDELLRRLADQRLQIDRRIAELQALQMELAELEDHVRHCQSAARPGQMAVECGFCAVIDEKGGEADGR
jgi:MerR family mercuric resistance operon transcriptional regulator